MSNVIYVNFKDKRKLSTSETMPVLAGLLLTIHNAKIMSGDALVNDALNLYLGIPRP